MKHFALDYISVIFGLPINWVRAANWLFPSFLLGGIWAVYSEANFINLPGILILLWIALMVFIGFIYFRIVPVNWDELNISQKFQYGHAIFSGQLTKKKELSLKQQDEWIEIYETYGKDIYGDPYENIKKKYKFYNLKPFLVNIIALIVTLIIIFKLM